MENKIKDFIDLEIYQLAEKSAVDIEKLLRSKDSLSKKWKAVDHAIESAVSMGANIAEGFGRFHFRENLNFLYFARGSLCETRRRLRHFYLVGNLTADEIRPISNDRKRLNVKINNSIVSTRQQIQKNNKTKKQQ